MEHLPSKRAKNAPAAPAVPTPEAQNQQCIKRLEANWPLDARSNESDEKFQKMVQKFCKSAYLKQELETESEKKKIEKQFKQIKKY